MSIRNACYVQVMPLKSGRNEDARDRSRAALLQAGADLMVEDASRHPFAALRLRRLCDQAGYSTGAFYVHWASLEEYYRDLAKHLSGDEMFGATFKALADLAESYADLGTPEAIAHVADQDIQWLVEDPLWDATELMNVTWGRTQLRQPMANEYHRHDRAGGEIYGSILVRKGREPRPPYDWDCIGAIIQALAEGFGLRYKVDPSAPSQSSESARGLYATAVAAVLAVLTRPSGDTSSGDEAIEILLETSSPVASLLSKETTGTDDSSAG